MNFKTLALAAIGAVGISGAASAATFNIGPNAGVDYVFGTGNFKACATDTQCYNPTGSAAGILAVGDVVKSFDDPAFYPGLRIDGPTTLRVTFLGKEAAANNVAFSTGGGSVSNTDGLGSTFDFVVAAAGTVDFTFKALSVVTGSMAGFEGFALNGGIAFKLFNGGKGVYAFFDDSGADKDRDWDDMVVKIEVVPVPAAGLLLLGGLGAMAAMKRRRKAA